MVDVPAKATAELTADPDPGHTVFNNFDAYCATTLNPYPAVPTLPTLSINSFAESSDNSLPLNEAINATNKLCIINNTYISDIGIGFNAIVADMLEKTLLRCLAILCTTSFNLEAILNPICASKSRMASSNISSSSSILYLPLYILCSYSTPFTIFYL